METLRGQKIYLRALEPDDLEYLFTVENNEKFWEVSSTTTPFSKYLLWQYLENSHKDIFEVKQLRLMICERDGSRRGFIDLFDFDPKNRRAAVGIIINSEGDRQKGFGAEALNMLITYCFTHLELHQIYAGVGIDNVSSKMLFEKAGFIKTGQKKDWLRVNGTYKDELIYQLINTHVH